MWEWLLLPIDPGRAHLVDASLAWHGRLMVLAWAVLVPAAILIARFAKVLPQQQWPDELDNQIWWRSHWILQSLATLLCGFAFYLVWHGMPLRDTGVHGWTGRVLLVLLVLQVLSGVLRGSKGGPTAPNADGTIDGDHYSMTPRRRAFEWFHKSLGYGLLLASVWGVVSGLWAANAPRWMWLGVVFWWLCLLVTFVGLQRSGHAIDTYQAIWGPDPAHPGNRARATRWGARRLSDETES